MADWVLKGSIKGPQGDPGADAQLPEGGTTGDFLQKNADGTGWFNSEGLLRASYIGNLQQLGDAGQSLEIHNVSVTSNGYVAGASTDNPPEDGAFVYADDKNSSHLGHNRVGVLNGVPYVDLDTTDATGENGHLAADGRYSYVDDIEAADAAEEQGDALTIPTGAAVKQYVEAHAGDALPEGGTDGQVLTSDGVGGAAWESVPQPDLTGVLEIVNEEMEPGNPIDVLKKKTADGSEPVNSAYLSARNQDGETNYISYTNGLAANLSLVSGKNDGSSYYMVDLRTAEATANGSAQVTALYKELTGAFIKAEKDESTISANYSNTQSIGLFANDAGSGVEALTSEGRTRYSISDTISSTEDTLATGKGVAAYVAANAPEVDLSGYTSINSEYVLQKNDGGTSANAGRVKFAPVQGAGSGYVVIDTASYSSSINVHTGSNTAEVKVDATGGEYASISATWDDTAEIATNGRLRLKSKYVTEISDTVGTGHERSLATTKAVKDYVDANASTVKTASNQDFCAYMGMEYNAEDWS